MTALVYSGDVAQSRTLNQSLHNILTTSDNCPDPKALLLTKLQPIRSLVLTIYIEHVGGHAMPSHRLGPRLWQQVVDTGIIDFTQPVALLMIAVSHVQQRDEYDHDIGDQGVGTGTSQHGSWRQGESMVAEDGVCAVVFDLDGVLVDSEQLWDAVRRGVAAEAGRSWPPEATRAMQGMSTPEWSAYLTDVVRIPAEPQEVAALVIDRMAAAYDARLPLLPGAVEVVERLGQRWPLGLASSSPRRLIDTVLDSAGFAQRFQASVSTEEVGPGKPSPVVYQTVVQRLGVNPGQAVAIEDSSNGLRSAARAGLGVLAVPNAAFPPSEDALALASIVVNSLDEITPELVISFGDPDH